MRARWLWMVMVIALVLALPAAAYAEPVDLNSASMSQLMELPSVGRHRAEEIIRYRVQRGGFRRPSDLLRIKGIGRRTYYKLRPLIEVRPLSRGDGEEAAQ